MKRLPLIVWFAILALATGLRIGPIGAGLPYSDYVDEGHVLHQVVTFLDKGTVNIGNYSYPWLPSFLITGAVSAYSPIYHAVQGRSLRSDLAIGSQASKSGTGYYDLISPSDLIVLGRLVVALLSVLTVVLTGWLGTKIAGPATGLGAMLLTAVCPALVSRASNVIIDSIAALFVMATLCLCERLRRTPDLQSRTALWVALSVGMMIGLAFASKYTMAVTAIIAVAAIALLPVSLGRKITLLLSAGLSAVAMTAVANPILAMEPLKVMATMQGMSGFYDTMAFETYWAAAITSTELGLLFVVAGIAGTFWLLMLPATRAATLSWLAFTILLLTFLVPHRFQPFRNLVPVIPFLCIAAAFFVVQIGRLLAAKLPTQAYASLVSPILLLTLAGSMLIPTCRHLHAKTSHVDARLQAIDWLRKNTRKSHRILATEELAIYPSEWKRVRGKVEVVPWTAALQRSREEPFDFVVSGEFMLQFAPNPETLAAYRSEWIAELAPMQVAAKFGQVETPTDSGVWRSSDQRILILANQPR